MEMVKLINVYCGHATNTASQPVMITLMEARYAQDLQL